MRDGGRFYGDVVFIDGIRQSPQGSREETEGIYLKSIHTLVSFMKFTFRTHMLQFTRIEV